MADLTRFVERNPLLRDEVREVMFNPTDVLAGESRDHGTCFYSLGQINSEVLGSRVYVGKKVFKGIRKEIDVTASICNSLILLEFCPEIEPFMPKFMIGIRENGEYKGILMEDYSRAKQEVVPEASESEISILPENFFSLMDKANDSRTYFTNSSQGLKLMDFNYFDWRDDIRNLRYERCAEIENDPSIIASHVIEI